MNFFFLHDYRHRPRFFSAEPLGSLPANFSKSREVWEKAKRKVTGLNPRTLFQEQAFEHGGRPGQGPLRILHSGRHDEKSIRTRFLFFLQRAKTRHIFVLAAEAIVVPFTGLVALLPGPNIVFYVLAILMIIQWQAVRGIGRVLRRELEFVADPLLAEWEAAVDAHDEAAFPDILARLEKTHGLPSPRKLLWK
jgi:Na+-transporting methylmalonyl-CoA/oxaloacetate decarboxylase gamma subunit